MTLLLSLAWPVGSLGYLLSFAREAATAADRVVEVFDAPVTIASGATRIAEPRGRLELCDVSFTFDDATEPTLHGLNLTLEPGRPSHWSEAPGRASRRWCR
ncbi:hypothetical protein [Tessaracoccus coleopterorum]|uniref:hypothetical protein n=1 Tax=Tessaracoccus coleopterorum TaxID=2714950 RepID=UPI001E3175B9|nr:hypothetical protein [Tessaracoccus coleopterorum]